MTYPFASLPANLAAFCDLLRRQHGFHVGPGELRDAARALHVVDLASERAVRNALRPILASTRDDVMAFDAAFTRFFLSEPADGSQDDTVSASRDPGAEGNGREVEAARTHPVPTSAVDVEHVVGAAGGPMTPIESSGDDHEEAALFAASSYSPLDADASAGPELPRVDEAWSAAARVFVRRLHLGLSRRWRPATRGRRFDLRRTLRAGLQTGGEALSPRWRRRPRRTPRIVLIVDGSRSMSAYVRTTLTIAVALASATMRIDVFTFSTGLERVTTDVGRAARGERRQLGRLHKAWAGGTSIGGCLRDFLQRFADRLVARDTVVMIASDGLDVGAPNVLRDAMRELERRSAGVVWLNPLLSTEGYEPTAAGMSAARPHVSTFASVEDEAGLARLSRLVRLRA